MSESEEPIEVSIIVPLYDEEDNVALLYERITQAVSSLAQSYEILFVNDGSRDRTSDIAASLAMGDGRLKIINLRQNYGQTPAMSAGIDHARGNLIVTMDGDLQNDPADIPAMLAELTDEYDLVVGWRKNRQDKAITRKLPSWVANRLIGAITGVPIIDNGCSLRVYRGAFIRRLPLYSEMHRFIPALASMAGGRVRQMAVRHHARQFGQSKYGLSRIFKVLLDLVVIKVLMSFSQRPLAWAGIWASPFVTMSLLFFVVSTPPWGGGEEVISVPFAGSAILLFASALFLAICGALGELIYATGDRTSRGGSRGIAGSQQSRAPLMSSHFNRSSTTRDDVEDA